MRNIFLVFSILFFGFVTACATVANEPKTNTDLASHKKVPDPLKVWVEGRAGTGPAVHWVADGGVYEYPSGKKLFGLIGLESSTVIWPETAGEEIIHLTRKTFAYTDKDTGKVITEYEGEKVEPIAYPYQLIRYRLEDGRIYGDVEQGVGERIQFIKATNGIPFRKLGDTYIFNASVWLDFPLPSGAQYEAWENYDFFFNPEGSIEEPHQMSWQRYGKLPAWAGGQTAITHLHSWRVEEHSEIPQQIFDWVQQEKPMWLKPPASLQEVRDLQEGKGGPGWSG
ncbi:MAG: hypothetical protein AAGA09_01685 [Pseudomonadota bacterium]